LREKVRPRTGDPGPIVRNGVYRDPSSSAIAEVKQGRRPVTRMTRWRGGRRAEAQIQRAVFQHLRTRGAPGVFAFHPANGGYRKPVEAAILKGLGVVAGVPDLIAIHNGRVFAMEIKAPGGCVSPKQRACIAALEASGVTTAVAYSLDEALATLELWGLLRGCAVLPQGKPGDELATRAGAEEGSKTYEQFNVRRRSAQ